ncbi:MAG: hypoxanthine phosphoribosyltransferase [Bacteroidales bacterium]|nr:hypoxanthine phosphoribosyltransferase [Bacteroidales bacterium]
MATVQVKDKVFKPYLSEKQILAKIDELAQRINRDLAGKNPLFVCVLNGAFMFASDLMKKVTIDCEVSFIRLKSYHGTSSTGVTKEILGLVDDIEGRTVVLIEDIVDTGRTLVGLYESLNAFKPESIRTAVLLYKPDAVECEVSLDYVAFEIPNDFIVGYGLDYDGNGRNLNDIYVIC